MTEHLRFAVENGVATITLDRPKRLNAFTDDMLFAWLDSPRECQSRDDVQFVVSRPTGATARRA